MQPFVPKLMFALVSVYYSLATRKTVQKLHFDFYEERTVESLRNRRIAPHHDKIQEWGLVPWESLFRSLEYFHSFQRIYYTNYQTSSDFTRKKPLSGYYQNVVLCLYIYIYIEDY